MSDLLVPLVDEELGNSAYLVDLGDGRALAVDAPTNRSGLPCRRTRSGSCWRTAASLLERAGRTDMSVLAGGPGEYAAAHGRQLVR